MSKFSTFLNILQGVAPLVLMTIPGKTGTVARAIAPMIVQGIVEAQQIPGASNTEKKAYVMNLVEDAHTVLVDQAGITIPHDELVAAASSAIDTVIDTAHVVAGTHKAVKPAVQETSRPTN